MATTNYTVIWGRTPGELIHENSYADEKMAWSVYRNLSFTDYAALLCGCEVIAHNGERGPVINGDLRSEK